MDVLARDLRLAVGRLSRRLRRLYVDVDEGLTFLELAVLQRLDRMGPTSPGALADHEQVTSAAIAAVLGSLVTAELITRSPDPDDRRKAVVAITASGRRALATRDAASVHRLGAALAESLDADERRLLAAALPLIEKVAQRL